MPLFTISHFCSSFAAGIVTVWLTVLVDPARKPIMLGRFTFASTLISIPACSFFVGTIRSSTSSTGTSLPLFTAVALTLETSPPNESVLTLPSELPSGSMLLPESAKAETTKAATAASTSVTRPPTRRRLGQRRGDCGG